MSEWTERASDDPLPFSWRSEHMERLSKDGLGLLCRSEDTEWTSPESSWRSEKTEPPSDEGFLFSCRSEQTDRNSSLCEDDGSLKTLPLENADRRRRINGTVHVVDASTEPGNVPWSCTRMGRWLSEFKEQSAFGARRNRCRLLHIAGDVGVLVDRTGEPYRRCVHGVGEEEDWRGRKWREEEEERLVWRRCLEGGESGRWLGETVGGCAATTVAGDRCCFVRRDWGDWGELALSCNGTLEYDTKRGSMRSIAQRRRQVGRLLIVEGYKVKGTSSGYCSNSKFTMMQFCKGHPELTWCTFEIWNKAKSKVWTKSKAVQLSS